MPGYRGKRVECAECGEGINFNREVERAGRVLCIPCSQEELRSNGHVSGANTANPKVLLIVGYKKVGKTTLIERLIPELSRRGYRVGTVKHHHSDFPVSVDTVGTDSWRHRQAGATGVALVTPTDIALFRNGENSLSLDDIVAGLGATDIVLVEGFHNEPRAQNRSALGSQRCSVVREGQEPACGRGARGAASLGADLCARKHPAHRRFHRARDFGANLKTGASKRDQIP